MTKLFDVANFKQHSISELLSIFSSINPSQNNLLLLEKRLSVTIDSLISFSKLKKSANLSRVSWLNYDQSNEDVGSMIDGTDSLVLMLTYTTLNDLVRLSRFLKEKLLIFNESALQIYIILVDPGMIESARIALEGQGVLGDIAGIYHWKMGSYTVLQDDIVSLEMNHGGLDQLMKYDSIEPIEWLAKALLSIVVNSNYKVRLTNIYLKGDWSIKFWKIYRRLVKKQLNGLSAKDRRVIQDLDDALFSDQYSFFNRSVDFVCLDRSIDLVGCLMTQLTYSGLVDEILSNSFDIKNDKIYDKIKDLNFSMVGGVLNKTARDLQSEYDKRSKLKSIDEMKSFVGELNHLKDLQRSVQKHTDIAEDIVTKVNPPHEKSPYDSILGTSPAIFNYYGEFIELQQDITSDNCDTKKCCSRIIDLMYKYEPQIWDIVRLMIILSIVKKGIKEQEYSNLKTKIIDAYGISYIPLLLKLSETKLVYPRESQLSFLTGTTTDSENSSKYQLIRDFKALSYSMSLLPIVENPDLMNPTEADFALPGYVPITTRLVQAIYDRSFMTGAANAPKDSRYHKFGWDNLGMSNLNGQVQQDLLVPETKRGLFSTLIPPKKSQLGKTHERRDMIIVAVIGGLTYAEIATIRYVLSANELTKDKQLIILSTGVIKGTDVVQSLA